MLSLSLSLTLVLVLALEIRATWRNFCYLIFDIVIYIDDTILVARTYEDMKRNIALTLKCFKDAGLLINYQKSNLEPSQKLVFLGLLIDTVAYTISLTSHIHDTCSRILKHPKSKIKMKYLAKLIGKIIATFLASKHGPLHYRVLDHLKVKCLIRNRQNWLGPCVLNANSITVIKWWHNNIFT